MGDPAGASEGARDPVGGALGSSGVLGPRSQGVGVKGAPPLAGEAAALGPPQGEAGLLGPASPGSAETFLGRVGAGAEAGAGRTAWPVAPLVGEAGGLRGALVQPAVDGRALAGRDTGKGADDGRLCTRSPVEEPAQTRLARTPGGRLRPALPPASLALRGALPAGKVTCASLLPTPCSLLPLCLSVGTSLKARGDRGSVNTRVANTWKELILSPACLKLPLTGELTFTRNFLDCFGGGAVPQYLR